MNFRGNTFSLGGGQLVSTRMCADSGACEFFIKNSGVIARRSFWQGSRKLQTSERNASFADACWQVDGGMIEMRNNRITFERRNQ